MSIFLRPQKVCESCGQVWYPADEVESVNCPNCGSAHIRNEKWSLYVTVLFYSAGLVTLVWMLAHWKEVELPLVMEPAVELAETLTPSEQQVQLPSIEEELDTSTEPTLVTPPQKSETKEPPTVLSTEAESLPPPVQSTETTLEPGRDIVTVETPAPEPAINNETVAFSLWSISELRLRSLYTKLMNDGSLRAELRKKEYLQYVNSRNKKCGELNSQYAKNINAMDKVTFKEGDLAVLECHSAENTSELNRLKLMGYDG